VLMVIFDILASHHRMLTWHERSIEVHLVEMASLQRQQGAVEGSPMEGAEPAATDGETSSRQEGTGVETADTPAVEGSPSEGGLDGKGIATTADVFSLDRR